MINSFLKDLEKTIKSDYDLEKISKKVEYLNAFW
jgi:hypothetical protein